MDRQAIREEVRERAEDTAGQLASDDLVNQWIDLAVRRVWRHWPWAFARTRTTINTVANTATVDLPADAQRPTKVVNTTNKLVLEPRPMRWLEDVLVGATASQPLFYTDGGLSQTENTAAPVRRLRLFPTPDKVYALEVSYIKTPARLTDDDEFHPLPEDFDEAIILQVLVWYYRKMDDFQQADAHHAEFREELARLTEVYGNWQAEAFPIIHQEVYDY